MKHFIIPMLLCWSLAAAAQTPTLTPGSAAPDFELQNTDGNMVSLADYATAKGAIVVFTCNTCPYAKAYEQRILELDKKYKPLGFPVIAINPNDPEASPGDSFENMKALATSHRYTFPYLFDRGQAVTALYGARNTPHLFLITKTPEGAKIAYTGAIDNDTKNESSDKIKYVEDAITALLNKQQPAVAVTKAIGCTVKWKKN